MKKSHAYHILQLDFGMIKPLIPLKEEEPAILNHTSFRNLLLEMLPAASRVNLPADAAAEKIAEQAAITVPYNAALRLIHMQKHPDAHSDTLNNGPEEPCSFLRDILQIDIASEKIVSCPQLRNLLNGLTLCFSDSDRVDYVLFERSASQVRNQTVVMIRKDLQETLQDAIRCGVPGETTAYVPSKYAAYRALLLSSGVCVPLEKQLDENSVIIVSDFQVKHWIEFLKDRGMPDAESRDAAAELPTATVSYKVNEEKGRVENIRYCEAKQSAEEDKLFDGEGLICPELADEIAGKIFPEKGGEETEVASFQIRMPLIKGVVHKVDFSGLLQELLGAQEKELWIRDAFGHRRMLSAVKMILTVSMFKMYWAFKSTKTNISDYWTAFREKKHALFVCNCDARMRGTSTRTVTNYQFLSTLSGGNEKALAEQSVAALWNDTQSREMALLSFLARTGEQADESEYAGLPGEQAAEADTEALPPDVRCLKKNRGLANTALFRDVMKRLPAEREFSRGHLFVSGTMKYLSGDLLQFLALLADRCVFLDSRPESAKAFPANETETEQASAFFREVIGTNGQLIWEWGDGTGVFFDYYYAPGTPAVEKAVIDRNPHLARNEHVIARPLPEPGETSFRTRYLGHLKGTVMLRGSKVRSAYRLSGADYDGDLVRIIYDPAYVAAADLTVDGNDCIETRLPLNIPSVISEKGSGQQKPFGLEVQRGLVADGLVSRVGLFSNYGFRAALFAQNRRRKLTDDPASVEAFAQDAREEIVILSCMTGLEIDSAKTNMRPVFDRKKTLSTKAEKLSEKQTGCKGLYHLGAFLDFKQELKKKKLKKQAVEQTPFWLLRKTHGTYSFLELLPYVFVRHIEVKGEENEPACGYTPVPEWAEDYRNGLWEKPDAAGRIRKSFDSYTAYRPKTVPVSDLLDLGAEQIPTPDATMARRIAAAFLAIRAHNRQTDGDAVSSAGGRMQPRSAEKLTELNRLIAWSLGRQIAESFESAIKESAQNATDEQVEGAVGLLFRIVPWKRLSSSEFRLHCLQKLFDQNGISMDCSESALLYTLCKTDAHSSAETDTLLALLTKDSAEECLEEKEWTEREQRALQKLFSGIRGEKPEQTKATGSEIAEVLQRSEFTVSYGAGEDGAKSEIDWIAETDCEKRKSFLKQQFPLWDTLTEETQNLLAQPAMWQVLLYFLELIILFSQEARKTRKCREAFLAWLEGEAFGEAYTNVQLAFLETEAGHKKQIRLIRNAVEEIVSSARWTVPEIGTDDSHVKALRDFAGQFSPEACDISGIKEAGFCELNGCTIPVQALLLFCLLQKCSASDKINPYGKKISAAVFRYVCWQKKNEDAVRVLFAAARDRKADEIRTVERFAYRIFPDAFYRLLKPGSVLAPVQEEKPDFSVGYLDGCQTVAIVNDKVKKPKREEEIKLCVTIRPVHVCDEEQLTAEELAERLKNAVSCAVPEGGNLPEVEAEVRSDTEKILRERTWKRLVSAEIQLKAGGSLLHRCITTVLFLPESERYDCIRGNAEELTECFAVSVCRSGNQLFPMPYAQEDNMQKGRIRRHPLRQFIFAYQLYNRSSPQETALSDDENPEDAVTEEEEA